MAIKQEIIAAENKDGDFWTKDHSNDRNVPVPFPFIATCLVIGASFNIDGYYHGVSIEPFNMAYDEGDNNNGEWLHLFLPSTCRSRSKYGVINPTNIRLACDDKKAME